MNNFDIFGHGEAISEAKNCLSEIVEIIDNRVQLVYHALQYFYNNSNSQTMRWGLEKRQEKLLNAKDSIHFYFMKILTEIENCVTLTSDRNAYSEDQDIDENLDFTCSPSSTDVLEKYKDFFEKQKTTIDKGADVYSQQ